MAGSLVGVPIAAVRAGTTRAVRPDLTVLGTNLALPFPVARTVTLTRIVLPASAATTRYRAVFLVVTVV
ncbi:MAG: hypothetical protein LBH13_02025 [Cellulomonadaceae bacterium]|nr:hypothetical protein [Cellulomonadaceae bacterium]